VICLTFDTDWMSDGAMAHFLEQIEIPGTGTFFLHDVLPSLFATRHELCPHPFIDSLRDWEKSVSVVSSRLPRAAKGVRAHSCVFSHALGVGFHRVGFRYVSQATNFYQDGLTPLRHPWGIWEMPIYYMDNMDFWTGKNWPELRHQPFGKDVIRRAVDGDSLYVFDFHPLHIALNTRRHEDYEAVKDRVLGGASPFDLAFEGRGVRVFFAELCSAMNANRLRSYGCWEALQALGCR
jgi:hypothetical protein